MHFHMKNYVRNKEKISMHVCTDSTNEKKNPFTIDGMPGCLAIVNAGGLFSKITLLFMFRAAK